MDIREEVGGDVQDLMNELTLDLEAVSYDFVFEYEGFNFRITVERLD